jgi:hypothetical protein
VGLKVLFIYLFDSVKEPENRRRITKNKKKVKDEEDI